MTDPAVPVEVRLEVYAPLVPGNVRDSGMPCAVSNLTVVNRGKEPVSIELLAVQQNAVGVDPNLPPEGRRSAAYGGNVNRIVRERGLTLISMERPSKPGSGTMALATPAAGITAIADCGNVADLLARFTQGGKIASQAAQNVETTPPSLDGTTYDGALALGMRLKPGEARTTTFFLTWHFPGVKHGGDIEGWTSDGNMYENWWTSAEDVARELKRRLPELARTTRACHDTLYQSNLPVWLLDRISSQVAILRSMTCFWGRDGYFGAWEGCGGEKGCCAGNCSHVWHYAQAHARLWPELGRIMRQEELSHSTPEGAVPHRQPNAPPAFDGQCGTILESYREHLSSPDDGWLKAQWPKIRGALDYIIKRWDADEDGLLTGPQWNTLDENLGGNSSWLGSLYIAALKAGAKMAQRMGDAGATDRYERIARRASEHQDALLFNGEYYIQVPDPIPYRDYGPGCHIDQVLGQWWADMLDLGQVYPEEHMRSALTSVHRYNFHYDFVGITQSPRKFVHDDDAGTQMITWPRGGRPDPEHQMLYADEVMTGFEYAAAANMIARGLLEEGFRTVRAVADRYDGRLRTGLTPGDSASWGYSGNPFGDDECGKFYARSMSSWSLLLACQGFVYDGPARVIGFLPRWQPDDHASFFTAAEGWGLFTQKRTRGVTRVTLELRYGKLPIRTFVLQHTGVKTPQARVTLAGKPVKCSVEIAGDALRLKFSRSLTLKTGDRLDAVIN